MGKGTPSSNQHKSDRRKLTGSSGEARKEAPTFEVITESFCTFQKSKGQFPAPNIFATFPTAKPLLTRLTEQHFHHRLCQAGLGERGILLGSVCCPRAGAAEQKCKDGLSAATGMEPAGTHSHPAPDGSHAVMDEGQEPAPDLCPGGLDFA